MPSLTVVESVRCLDCGSMYAKPSGGGTVRENPGCPECGYVGWVAADDERAFNEAWSQPRFVASRLQHPHG
jgi:predicted  nucleic acid-binding Zn-ribbon protein